MIDLRRIRCAIEVNGRLQWYEGMRMHASGTKYANPLQNDCSFSIDGLNTQTRNMLLTETSPFTESKTPHRIILEAGGAVPAYSASLPAILSARKLRHRRM